MQTFHKKERSKQRHQHETEHHRYRQEQQTVPFELSPIPRPDTLFTTSTPTLTVEGLSPDSGRSHQLNPGPSSVDPTLPSPASAVASLTRDLEQSLSLQSAMRGQFVVKPQVTVAVCLTIPPLCPSPSSTLNC